jgi:glyoxylase-like metal-dependent hydrolase (beta-lactamase superfamily II)
VRLILAQLAFVTSLEFPLREAPVPGAARELAPGVHWLRMALPFALDHINLWLLEDEGGWTIVDTGLGDAPTRAMWETFFAGAIGARPVRRVLLTHFHPDHAGNAGWLCARFKAPLWMTQAEYLTAHAVRHGIGGHVPEATLALFRANGLDDAHHAQMSLRGNLYRRQVPEFPDSYRRLMDGERIAIGGRGWRVIVGHGHAPEHASLHCEDLGLAISGDMLLPSISTNVSVWPVDPEGDPLGLFLHSIQAYRELPAGTLVLPSHGLPFRGAQLRVRQLEAHHEARLADLLQACREAPRSAAEVLALLFRRKLDTHQMFFAMGEAIAHLHYLERAGSLRRVVGDDGVARFAPAREQAWTSALTA